MVGRRRDVPQFSKAAGVPAVRDQEEEEVEKTMSRFPQAVIDMALKQERDRAMPSLPCSLTKPPDTPAVCVPNKTEEEARTILSGVMNLLIWQYEDKTFELSNGHSFTPDWVNWDESIVVEVKSEYVHSRDSRILFDCAKQEYPGYTWIWMRKRTKGRKGKRWEVEIYPPVNR